MFCRIMDMWIKKDITRADPHTTRIFRNTKDHVSKGDHATRPFCMSKRCVSIRQCCANASQVLGASLYSRSAINAGYPGTSIFKTFISAQSSIRLNFAIFNPPYGDFDT